MRQSSVEKDNIKVCSIVCKIMSCVNGQEDTLGVCECVCVYINVCVPFLKTPCDTKKFPLYII